MPQAFSHFTWVVSNQAVLVCDIQGVGNYFTDPQIHSLDGNVSTLLMCGVVPLDCRAFLWLSFSDVCVVFDVFVSCLCVFVIIHMHVICLCVCVICHAFVVLLDVLLVFFRKIRCMSCLVSLSASGRHLTVYDYDYHNDIFNTYSAHVGQITERPIHCKRSISSF